ncbi:MAG: hypothetical protein FWC96_04905 [Oscillospiraceae bacterium]|nr:hypothetical protein [Oscillospiraceae bacterium]
MEILNVDIDCLKLSQIYLSQEKIDNVLAWFEPSLKNFEPIFVRDFLNNDNLHITDGHTRALIAWQYGIKRIPYIYDEDEIVTCELGQIQYEEDIVWCNRFGLHHISDLSNRILSEQEYEKLWRGRCGKIYNLKVALLEKSICLKEFNNKKEKLAQKDLFVYGISGDLSTLYLENNSGELFEALYISV